MNPKAVNIADTVSKPPRKLRKRSILFVIMLACALLCALVAAVPLACTLMRQSGDGNGMVKIREEMAPIEDAAGKITDSAKLYFEHYRLDMGPEVRHRFGTFTSRDWTLAAHIYEPAEYRGTVVLLHGYLNHCGQFRHLVRRLLDEGYAVAMYDMPGHGLSTGERAVIEDFSQYSDTVGDFIDVVNRLTHGPYDLIGFSTGGTVATDWMLTRDASRFRRVVLAAPLVHSPGWRSSLTGARFYSNFTDTVPRWPRKNTSDAAYVRFNRRDDVLHCRDVSLKWVMALHAWNDRMADREVCDRPVKVIQGTKDTTVSYKYNLQFIRGKFPAAEVTMIEGGRHELFNEAEGLRREVLDATMAYLNAEESDADSGQKAHAAAEMQE